MMRKEKNAQALGSQPPFFSDNAVEKMTKEMHLETIKNTKYDVMWFMRKFFESYSRCLYVDTGIGDREKY